MIIKIKQNSIMIMATVTKCERIIGKDDSRNSSDNKDFDRLIKFFVY